MKSLCLKMIWVILVSDVWEVYIDHNTPVNLFCDDRISVMSNDDKSLSFAVMNMTD